MASRGDGGGDGVTEIHLANGKGVALIDDEDASRVPLTGWCLHPMGYASRRHVRGRESLLHRMILQVPPGVEVDHINHDKLDCRKANLRLVTRSQNNQNKRSALRTNRLGIRGVSVQFNRGGTVSYFARVMLNGKAIHRCGFRTPEEAEAAAIALRRTYFTHSPECGR